ncbi:hypothetical protein MMC07_000985 [Pseudocyphellaria aurata]|nr:hypothetical protein [Pseudocyphellaria aurata]
MTYEEIVVILRLAEEIASEALTAVTTLTMNFTGPRSANIGTSHRSARPTHPLAVDRIIFTMRKYMRPMIPSTSSTIEVTKRKRRGLHATSNTGKGMEGHVTDCSDRWQLRALNVGKRPDRARKVPNADKGMTREEYVDDVRKKAAVTVRRRRKEVTRMAKREATAEASWSVRHIEPAASKIPDAGMALTIMDDDSDDDSTSRYQKLVEIVVSPGLFKRGNTDGERFDIESCLTRAAVRCYLKPTKAPET